MYCGVTADSKNNFREIDEFKSENHDWFFGHIAYDLKNEIENFSFENGDQFGFPNSGSFYLEFHKF